MYVAVIGSGPDRRYELRRTVAVEGGLGFEVVFDLGTAPGRQVRFGRFGVEYGEEIQDCIARLDLDPDDLDQAFAPYAPSGYRMAGDRSWTRTVLTRVQKDEILSLHPFDRRRMAYLRSGEVNLSRIDEVHPKLFRILVGKCRDEVEQLFLSMEQRLPADEARRYVYAIFNLQRHFASLAARTMPEAVDPVRLDEAFMLEFCRIHDNRDFVFGLPDGAEPYLRRYACLHFDCEFAAPDGFGRLFHDFMNDFRRHRPRSRPVPPDRVREIFGLTMAEIRRMSKREFARVFRKLAMSMHPDKGGDHDRFVELLDAYKRIVGSKSE